MQLSYKIFSTVSGKSVIISLDDRRYAFNIFEGFQRYCIEQRFSMCSVDAVFLPSKCAIPGFVGMYLTHGDSTKEELSVVSEGLVDMNVIHEFAQAQRIAIKLSTTYKDQYISVEPLVVSGEANYFINFRKVNGRFYPERVPVGVPKHLYKILAEGKTVPFEDQIIDGSEFCDIPVDLGILAIIFSTKTFNKLLERCRNAKTIICADIEAARYLSDALKDMDVTVYYIVNSAGVDYDGFYRDQISRNEQDKNFLLPESFLAGPGLGNCFDERSELEKKILNEHEKLKDFPGELFRTGDTLDYSRSEGFSVSRSVQKSYPNIVNHPAIPGIIFLGTGCSQPSKYRNVSAVLYEATEYAVLFDCGEDTLAQILRIYGSLDVLRKLRVIYLSHSHADHILGAAGILRHLKHEISIVGPGSCRRFIEGFYINEDGVLMNHTYILTSEAKRMEHEFYWANCGIHGRNWLIADCDVVAPAIEEVDIRSYVQSVKIGDFELQIVGCLHSLDSTSAVLSDPLLDMRVAYSGDTVPSLLFTALAYRADILIHEASFTAEQQDHANRTNHSTDEEAMAVFEYSKAKKLILTHFSNRNMHSATGSFFAADFYSVKFSN